MFYFLKYFSGLTGSRLDAVIGGLEPEVLYQVQVAAYTRKGDGERSRPKKVKTKGSGQKIIIIVSFYYLTC